MRNILDVPQPHSFQDTEAGELAFPMAREIKNGDTTRSKDCQGINDIDLYSFDTLNLMQGIPRRSNFLVILSTSLVTSHQALAIHF